MTAAEIDREQLWALLDRAAENMAVLNTLGDEREALRAEADRIKLAHAIDQRPGPRPDAGRLTEIQARLARLNRRQSELHQLAMPEIELARRCRDYAAARGVEVGHVSI